jgi:NAD(P)H dehydrogenase (quinone)
MHAVTGASGQLGRLVIEALLAKIVPSEIVALVRDPAKVADLADRGVLVRAFDYNAPEALVTALAGVERLLLISSNDLGKREQQHRAIIDAAKQAGVSFIAYTSILHADTSPIGLAVEHRATEAAIAESGLPYAFLRNGWYTENYAMSAPMSVKHGDGRISTAARADYADGAAVVLVDKSVTNKTFELAGDEGFTLTQYAAALAEVSGTPVAYINMPEDDYRRALEGVGMPAPVASMLADSSAKAAGNTLFDDGHALSKLIGRPTTPMIHTVKKALAG